MLPSVEFIAEISLAVSEVDGSNFAVIYKLPLDFGGYRCRLM